MTDTAALAAGPAVVIGAGGTIGAALVRALAVGRLTAPVVAVSRTELPPAPGIRPLCADLTDEASIAGAAAEVRRIGAPGLVLVATGWLHDAGRRPEKRWEDLSPEALAHAFAINATGPALVAKHFLPLLPPDRRAVFACLSARLGSIGDNRRGGWYAYRASKAALNMLVRTLAIELRRRAPLAVCVGLQPGTVHSPLSAPFVTAGAKHADTAAAELLSVLDRLTPADSGHQYAWDGSRIDP